MERFSLDPSRLEACIILQSNNDITDSLMETIEKEDETKENPESSDEDNSIVELITLE
jgi:hypothetical protein